VGLAEFLSDRIGADAGLAYGRLQFGFGDTEFFRPIRDLIILVDVDARGILWAAVALVVCHDLSPSTGDNCRDSREFNPA
jgi:hypothetical protein